ncbi:transposase [Chloroflexota bacterium]
MAEYKHYVTVVDMFELEDYKMVAEYKTLKCKFCDSKRVVRYGQYKKVQRWWCKDCKRKFADNDALPGMRTPITEIAAALTMFYEGLSLNGIRRNLDQIFNDYPSDSTVYGWIVRFTKAAIAEVKDYRMQVGSVWIADETVLKIEGRNFWFWDIIDNKTRFLLASHMSLTRTTKDARILVERAATRARKVPRLIITDKLAAYLDGIELAFGADTKHVQTKGFTTQPNTNMIERFHGTLKSRTKVMRGLKKRDSAKLVMEGWLVHYNFFRPHEALKDRTPAWAAGVKYPYYNWADIVRKAGT